MSILKRIRSNFIWGFLGETLGRGLMFVLLVVFSRRLGPEYFGYFSFIQSLFMFVWISIDLGLGLFGTRAIARSKHNLYDIANGVFFTRVALAAVVALFSICFSFITQNFEIAAVIAGFSIYLILRAAQTDWLLRGFEDYKYLCLVLSISYLALFITGMVLVKNQQDFYLTSVGWMMMGAIAVVLGLYRTCGNYNVRLNVKQASIRQTVEYWKTSIHFTLSNGVSALYEAMPVFFLFVFTSAELVGLYTAPFRLIVAAFFLVSIYPMTVFPVLSNLFSTNHTKYTQVIQYSAMGVFIVTAFVSLVSWLYADQIIIGLFSDQYIASIEVFKLLLLFFVFRSVRAVFVRAICAGNGEKQYSKIAMLGLCMLSVLMSLLYISGHLSLKSLAISLVITEFIILILLIIGVRRIITQLKTQSQKI